MGTSTQATTVFVTCRCVHQSDRLVPTAVVRRVVDYCFAVVSIRHRHGFCTRAKIGRLQAATFEACGLDEIRFDWIARSEEIRERSGR